MDLLQQNPEGVMATAQRHRCASNKLNHLTDWSYVLLLHNGHEIMH